MIISHTNKFIFFKSHKSASTSTEMFFEEFCDKDKDIIGWRGLKRNIPPDTEYWHHMQPKFIKAKILPEQWKTYYKFGGVRNPWDRVVSTYFFKRDYIKNKIPKNISFEDYIKNFKHHNPVSFNTWFNMSELQEDYKHNMYFIRYENLYQDILKICDTLNLKPKHNLKHIHKANRNADYRDYYNKETKEIIEKRYGHDIRLFNYTY